MKLQKIIRHFVNSIIHSWSYPVLLVIITKTGQKCWDTNAIFEYIGYIYLISSKISTLETSFFSWEINVAANKGSFRVGLLSNLWHGRPVCCFVLFISCKSPILHQISKEKPVENITSFSLLTHLYWSLGHQSFSPPQQDKATEEFLVTLASFKLLSIDVFEPCWIISFPDLNLYGRGRSR